MPIPIATTPSDDPEFLNYISTLSTRVAEVYSPEFIILVRVDKWFGFQWRGFSGKVLGLIGRWSNRDTLPPFVPNRIESQRTFAFPEFFEIDTGQPLHKKIPSDMARTRVMRKVVPNSVVIWFSGNSKPSKRGSAMVYVPSDKECLQFYAEWKEKNGWQLSRINGMSRTEFASLMVP